MNNKRPYGEESEVVWSGRSSVCRREWGIESEWGEIRSEGERLYSIDRQEKACTGRTIPNARSNGSRGSKVVEGSEKKSVRKVSCRSRFDYFGAIGWIRNC